MAKKNSFDKHKALLLLAVFLVGFVSGVFVYKNGLHLGATKFVKNIVNKNDDTKHFYQTPENYNLEPLFENQVVDYPYSFLVYGHSREPANEKKSLLIDEMIEEGPEFIFNLGDMVYYSDDHNWKIFDSFEGKFLVANISFYPVLGNHEYRYSGGIEYYNDPEIALMPLVDRFSFMEDRTWYSFTHGNSLFIVIDSNIDLSIDSVQYEWAKNILDESTSENIFVMLHHPMKPDSSIRQFEKPFRSLLENSQNMPDIVFSADFYDYTRYYSNDINYISTGGGGTLRIYPEIKQPGNLYGGSGKVFHYTKITVNEDSVIYQMIMLGENDELVVADSFSVE